MADPVQSENLDVAAAKVALKYSTFLHHFLVTETTNTRGKMRHWWCYTQNSFLHTKMISGVHKIQFCKTDFISVQIKSFRSKITGFLWTQISISSGSIRFCRKGYFLSKKCFCQHRIQFCLKDVFSVDKGNFFQLNKYNFFQERIQFCVMKCISFLRRDFCKEKKEEIWLSPKTKTLTPTKNPVVVRQRVLSAKESWTQPSQNSIEVMMTLEIIFCDG